jgi:hypothetical protein
VALPLSKALRTASIAICLLVGAYFVVFALNQTSTASGQQQEELESKAPAVQTTAPSPGAATAPATTGAAARESGLHRDLDEAAEALTAPVSGVSSQGGWGDHALRLIFALLVYGFALGYLARVLRVHA